MRFVGLSLVLVSIAACKSSAPAGPPSPPRETPPTPATAAFDGLFKSGASWRFAITSESSIWDDSDPAADANGNVINVSTSETRCKVTTTVTFPGGRASEIECSEGTDWRVAERIDGVWIQTTDGLWRHDSLPDEGQAPTLDPADRFLPASPRPVSTRQEDPESADGPAGGSTFTIEPFGDGWCVATSSWSGDESWQRLCLDATGPASGGTGFAGGSTSDITFERIE